MMMLRTVVVFLSFLMPFTACAQVLPEEGSKLTTRLVGFSFPAEKGVSEYKVEIAAGRINSEDQFAGSIVATERAKSNKVVAEVPAFGAEYTWHVVYGGKRNSSLYHFSTVKNARVDTTVQRLKVQQGKTTAGEMYVMMEGNGVIYDMSGNPVWYLADSLFPGGYLYDVKVTPQGTMTFLSKRRGYEVNYNGTILYQMPDHDSICKKVPGMYHHGFTRLPGGHYMVLGVEDLKCEKINSGGETTIATTIPKSGYRRNIGMGGNKAMGTFGTVLEFDANGNLVWSWKSSDYLLKSDFAYYTPQDTNKQFVAQATSFYFDEQQSAVYVGFKDLSRIVKIAYPAGNVLAVYGEPFKKGKPQRGNGLFCNPLSIGRAKDGDLYVYSNSTCRTNSFTPSVVVLHEPVGQTDELRTVWEYSISPALDTKMGITESGSATELPDGSFLVCTGKAEYSKMVIVSKDKKIVWSAMPERYDSDTRRFVNPEEYKVGIISRADMELMIWKASAR